ncbi:energy transducer TonB [Hymenobacter negativus]|uniref:Energy transducer TonB n=1 Tax=Hymenobacter negativus TaxID=2795026 RepID=A0ABS3Q8B8_9BACT|nr:energy transducer TonB [Hymenobacter negativus]MBO2007456.1 energy transducer TonB [Hymenobacter negativus]
MLVILGLVGGSIALYFLLLTVVPQYLHPEAVRDSLQWAHRGSGVLTLVAILVSCSSWDLSIRYPTLIALVVLGSGLMAGLRTKLALVAGSAWFLARAQSLLTPLLVPVLFLWIALRSADVVYWDGDVSVEVTTSTGWLSDITTTQITLYQTQALLFEKPVGHIHAADAANYLHPDQSFNKKEWWATVCKVTVDVDSLKGVVQTYSGYRPFVVSKPWRRENQQPTPPAEPASAPPLPVEDDKVYTYVEVMPTIPGGQERELGLGLNQLIQPWLVLPRDAVEGLVFLSLEVDKMGDVRNIRIAKGLNPRTDSAVLAAARQLPPLVPGRQNGRPLNVSLTFPVSVMKPRVTPKHNRKSAQSQ